MSETFLYYMIHAASHSNIYYHKFHHEFGQPSKCKMTKCSKIGFGPATSQPLIRNVTLIKQER